MNDDVGVEGRAGGRVGGKLIQRGQLALLIASADTKIFFHILIWRAPQWETVAVQVNKLILGQECRKTMNPDSSCCCCGC